MSEVYTYNATHLTTVREASFTQKAEHGQPGTFSVALDDTAGTQAIIGHKDFSHTESSCATPLTFRGFVGPTDFGRDAGAERKPHVGAARGIGINGEDLNAVLGFRGIHDPDDASVGKRPTETVAARVAWLLASDFLSGLVIDNGRITSVTGKMMTKADYRKQFPGDVLADCALAAGGFNHHVQDYGSGPELIFRDENASTADSSSLRISNVAADANATTLHPFKDAVLRRDPSRVKSKINYDYAKSGVVEERAATATSFNGERFGNASNSNVKDAATARRDAQAILWQLSTPEDFITCTVLVTSAQVNLIMPGYRIQAKFSHLGNTGGRNYDSFTWMRVVERTVRPIVADALLYEIDLRLSPQEEAQPAGSIVQSVFDSTGAGSTNLTLPNPVTIGNLLVYVVGDRGSLNPVAPSVSASSPRFGAGAWTKLPNTTNRTDYVAGVAIWYKTADATDNTGKIENTNASVGLFEIAGATITGASTLDETEQANNNTMDAGDFVSATSGSVMVAVIAWADQRYIHTPTPPGVAPVAGLVTDFAPSDVPPSSGGLAYSSPFVWIGHSIGTGATQAITITRSDPSVLTGVWCAAALLLEPV